MQSIREIYDHQGNSYRYSYFHLNSHILERDESFLAAYETDTLGPLYLKAYSYLEHIEKVEDIFNRLAEFDDMLWKLAPERPLKIFEDTLVQSIVENRYTYSHLIDETYTWSVYLAVLALSFLDEYDFMHGILFEHYEEQGKEFDADSHLMHYSTLANEALSAIWYIKYLDESGIEPKITENSRRAANLRHAPGQKVKKGFVDFYFAISATHKISKREAAKRFYNGLDQNDQRIICYTGKVESAVRTLTGHLRSVLQSH